MKQSENPYPENDRHCGNCKYREFSGVQCYDCIRLHYDDKDILIATKKNWSKRDEVSDDAE